MNICERCNKKYGYSHKCITLEELKERIKLRDKERDKNPARKLKKSEYRKSHPEIIAKISKRWNDNNKEKRSAHRIAYRALLSGKIIKQPCKDCGRTDDVEMHHMDYSKPLDVIFVCPTHHKKYDDIRKESTK